MIDDELDPELKQFEEKLRSLKPAAISYEFAHKSGGCQPAGVPAITPSRRKKRGKNVRNDTASGAPAGLHPPLMRYVVAGVALVLVFCLIHFRSGEEQVVISPPAIEIAVTYVPETREIEVFARSNVRTMLNDLLSELPVANVSERATDYPVVTLIASNSAQERGGISQEAPRWRHQRMFDDEMWIFNNNR